MNEQPHLAMTAAERKALKARAHHLNPVVTIGEAGLSPTVIAEAERAIAVHALIKVRVLGDDRDARTEMMGRLCDAIGAAPVQMIGKLLVLWRPKPAAEPRDNGPHLPKKIAGSGARPSDAPKPKAKPARARPASASAKPAWGKTASKSGSSRPGASKTSRSRTGPGGSAPGRSGAASDAPDQRRSRTTRSAPERDWSGPDAAPAQPRRRNAASPKPARSTGRPDASDRAGSGRGAAPRRPTTRPGRPTAAPRSKKR